MNKTFYIIDDHDLLRRGTISYLEANSDWKSAGDAKDGEKALGELETFAKEDNLPGIIICDLNFYGKNTGSTLIEEIRALYPKQKIIAYSMFTGPFLVQNTIDRGANGYISKNSDSEVLLLGMEKVLEGETFIQDGIRQELESYNSVLDALTVREKEVIDLLLNNLSNSQIAERLNIKKRAVENYISSIYEKTDINDRKTLIKKFGEER